MECMYKHVAKMKVKKCHSIKQKLLRQKMDILT